MVLFVRDPQTFEEGSAYHVRSYRREWKTVAEIRELVDDDYSGWEFFQFFGSPDADKWIVSVNSEGPLIAPAGWFQLRSEAGVLLDEW